LENGDVEVIKPEFHALGCQGLAQMTDPVGGVDVGIVSLRYACSKKACVTPFSRDVSNWNIVVFACDFLEFS
jgi:hypothetical protein